MRGDSLPRHSAASAVERLVGHYCQATVELSWMYGQGSVIAGLVEDSDLVLVLVWDTDVPSAPTLPAQSKLTVPGQLALEQSNVDGYDVDLMHVPRRTFETWMSELERGDGWAGSAWPRAVSVPS